MPMLQTADAVIHYEVHGAGAPVLLLPPGGMNAAMAFWERMPFHPLREYDRDFQLILLDERNSGASSGSVREGDPWAPYCDDHLALLEHLKVESALVYGCCIGASHALYMANRMPSRVRALVLQQPVGRTPENAHRLTSVWSEWATQMKERFGSCEASRIDRFASRMWEQDFVFSVSRQAVARMKMPMLVLPGNDNFHPPAIAEEIVALARHAQLLPGWKDSEAAVRQSVRAVHEFLGLTDRS